MKSDTAPEWRWGELKFYHVDNGRSEDIVVVKVRVDAIVDCRREWRPYFLGRSIEDIVEANPEVGIRRLRPEMEDEERYRRTGNRKVLTRGRRGE